MMLLWVNFTKVNIMNDKISEAQAILIANDSSNHQSMLDNANLRKTFGPKLDDLTSAINKASDSSEKLGKIIIGVTICGVIVSLLNIFY